MAHGSKLPSYIYIYIYIYIWKVSLRDLREGRLIGGARLAAAMLPINQLVILPERDVFFGQGPLSPKDFKRISRDIGENQPDDTVDFEAFVKMTLGAFDVATTDWVTHDDSLDHFLLRMRVDKTGVAKACVRE